MSSEAASANITPSPDPITVAKQDYRQLIEHISLPDSPVGIDAQYTHAIIIAYLQQISKRLSRLEEKIEGNLGASAS